MAKTMAELDPMDPAERRAGIDCEKQRRETAQTFIDLWTRGILTTEELAVHLESVVNSHQPEL